MRVQHTLRTLLILSITAYSYEADALVSTDTENFHSRLQDSIVNEDQQSRGFQKRIHKILEQTSGAEQVILLTNLAKFWESFTNEGAIESLLSLPVDVIKQLKFENPLSLVKCPTNHIPVSLFQCARGTQRQRALQASCFGSAAYSTDLGYCFTLSVVKPTSKCPDGFKLAKFPTDKYLGSCKATAKVNAVPSCDPPYILENDKCVYYSAVYGHIGCPVGSVITSDGVSCESAAQSLKTVSCPAGYTPFLEDDGTGICTKRHRFRGNYSSLEKCPKNTEEIIDYDNLDEELRPTVTCLLTEVTSGETGCERSQSLPFSNYLEVYLNNPPILFNEDFGNPNRTCITIQTTSVTPVCPDPVKQEAFISPGQKLMMPLRMDLLLPVTLVNDEATPDWATFKPHLTQILVTDPNSHSYSEVEGRYYRSLKGQEIVIGCVSRGYAQPVLKCEAGYQQTKRDPTVCRLYQFSDFELICPAGYRLNHLALAYQPLNKPDPDCVGQLKARTTFYCPVNQEQLNHSGPDVLAILKNNASTDVSVLQTHQTILYPVEPIYLPDPINKRCVQAVIAPPLYSPSIKDVDALFPGFTDALIQNNIRYPGVYQL